MRNIIELWKRWIARVKGDCFLEEIRFIAYQKAKARNFEPGHEWEDWFEAEKEVVSRHYEKYANNLSIS